MNFILPIPRAIYYMNPISALASLIKIHFTKHKPNIIKEFEMNFSSLVGANHSVATSHARMALFVLLKSLELKAGDEVLMSPVNLPDMINMITLNNLCPRFFDYEKKSLNFDVNDFKSKITNKTKIVFITILSGIETNLSALLEICHSNKIIVILDQTQSLGLKLDGQPLTSKADFSIYSLCDLKDIHTHRGGMISFNEGRIISKIRLVLNEITTTPSKAYFIKFISEDLLSSFILRRLIFTIIIYPFLYFLHKNNKSKIIEELTKGSGIKIGKFIIGRGIWGGDGNVIRNNLPVEIRYTFTTLQAEIGLNRIKKIDKIHKRRILYAEHVNNILKEMNILFNPNKKHVYWKYPIWCDDPEKMKKNLFQVGIDIAPSNLPCLTTLDTFANIIKDQTPNAIKMQRHILYLPLHYYLNKNEISFVGDNALRELLRQVPDSN